jgi:hypothetical protein
LVVTSLTLDMLHYCVGSIIWRRFYTSKEKAHVSEAAELNHDALLELPIWALFVLKIACVVAAYVCIFVFLIGRLSQSG